MENTSIRSIYCYNNVIPKGNRFYGFDLFDSSGTAISYFRNALFMNDEDLDDVIYSNHEFSGLNIDSIKLRDENQKSIIVWTTKYIYHVSLATDTFYMTVAWVTRDPVIYEQTDGLAA